MVFKRALFGFLFLMNTAYAQAPSFKTLLMPGPVIEAHSELESGCINCHSSFDKQAQDGLCADCHEKIAYDLDQKQGFHGRISEGSNCTRCHTDHIGRGADIIKLIEESFDHQLTDFALQGGHKKVVCKACHKAAVKYREALNVCFDCHQQDDRHLEQLGKTCDDCHSPDTWTKTSFDHEKTQFPLKDKHKDVFCAACHPDQRYKNIAKTCYSCHALNDVHAGAYGENCANCHTVTQWDRISFDHDLKTDFALLGGHKKAACQTCHTQGAIEKSLGTICVDCHQGDDEHHGKNGKECASCHEESNWSTLIFNHDRDSKYSLQGKHADADCSACHKGPVYEEKLEFACIACHALDDVHEGQQGEQCERCHQQQAWGENVIFEHDLTAFPLIGLHAAVACEVCHVGGSFKEIKSSCVGCHEVDDAHNGTLGDKCYQCHNPNAWDLWQFDHDRQTKFALAGAHQDLACASCHVKPYEVSVTLPTSCVSCHRSDDIHNSGFGVDCDRCHSMDRFDNLQKLSRW